MINNYTIYFIKRIDKIFVWPIADDIAIFILQIVKEHMKTLVGILISIIILISTAHMAIAQNTTTNATGNTTESGGMSSESVEMAQ